MSKLIFFPKGVTPKRKNIVRPDTSLLGKTVFFQNEGVEVAGVVTGGASDTGYEVSYALPDARGILNRTDVKQVVAASSLTTFKGVVAEYEKRLAAFETNAGMRESVKFVPVKSEDGDKVIDYRDVAFGALASTFQHVTPADRDGDYVVPGAFTDTLAAFMRNPVMLTDHWNSVANIAGSYSKVAEGRDGLLVEGSVSNAPDMISVRFKIVEQHLRALSIGGIFLYGADGRAIEHVNLWEISLCAIPANPDALITTRSVKAADVVKFYGQRKSAREAAAYAA